MKRSIFCVIAMCYVCLFLTTVFAQNQTAFFPGQRWEDVDGNTINAHGGGMLFHKGRYYWYGENRPEKGFTTEVGIGVYSSDDLLNWKDEGVALAVSEEKGSPIERGCIIERPKVIYNELTKKYVMLFHLELKGQGYAAARVGFAVAEQPEGPFTFIRSLRPNAGKWPADFSEQDIRKALTLDEADYPDWWTQSWRKAIADGLLLKRDIEGGQMSRDMTVFVDDDGKAYHIFSAEENLTLNLAELTSDYLDYTGKYIRIAPGGQNEAPTIFKRQGVYWLITSGCTGWEPNEARMFRSTSLWGPWEQLPNPFVGENANKTFFSQGTYIFKKENTEDGYIFMADRWMPASLKYSPYVWLPIDFDGEGCPVIKWRDQWSPEELK